MASNIQDEYNTDIYDEHLVQFLALPPSGVIPPADLQFFDELGTPEIQDVVPALSYEARIKPLTDGAEAKNRKKMEEEMSFKRLLCYDYPDPEDDPPEEWTPPIYWINSRIDPRFLQQARFPKRRYDLITKGYLPPIEVPEIQFYNTLHNLLNDHEFERVHSRLVYYGFTEVCHLFDWDIEVCDYLIEDIVCNYNNIDKSAMWDKWISMVVDILKNYKRCVLS